MIPIVGSFYWVQPGDNLWAIANGFCKPIIELATVNGISPNQPLIIGTRLYIPPLPKTNREFNAYVEPRGTTVAPNLEESARDAAPHLTYLAPFSFQALRDGSLKEPLLNNFPAIAKANNNILMMVITNQENDQFSDELGRILLNDTVIQDRFLNNIVTTAKNTDSEIFILILNFYDQSIVRHITSFYEKQKLALISTDGCFSTALAPKTSAGQTGLWYEAHDYRAHGEIVDFVVIMTYEWGYSGGPAMAVSPIGPVRNVLEYAISEMPASKILMGQNLYGYDWTLPFVQGTIARAL